MRDKEGPGTGPARMTGAGGESPVSRALFLALTANRLSSLPAPYPDLAVISITVPEVVSFQQAYGEAVSDDLSRSICKAVMQFAPEAVLGYVGEGQFALAYEFDRAWTNLEEVVSDLRAIIGSLSHGSAAPLTAAPNFGAAIHNPAARTGSSLESAAELIRQSALAAQLAHSTDDRDLRIYSLEDDKLIRRGVVLDQALRLAVARDEFLVYYQPCIDMRTLAVVGLEGLVRWAAPGAGIRAPKDFIPAAEASGLIVQIGASVFLEGMRQVDRWIAAGWQPPRVAINVSAAQLRDPSFRDMVVNTVTRGRVKPEHLELEMTERTLIVGSMTTRRLLDEFRDLGITIALDDFGTGYSSLQYLRELPITKLKIDRSFIQGITTDKREAALVKTIVGLGDAFGLDVVAEGIEHWDQSEALLECGCFVGQGYLFSHPVPPADLPAFQGSLLSAHEGSAKRALVASHGPTPPA